MHLEESQVVADDEFFLQNAMPIKRRFCQRLSLLLYHRQQNILDKINAVMYSRSKTGRCMSAVPEAPFPLPPAYFYSCFIVHAVKYHHPQTSFKLRSLIQ